LNEQRMETPSIQYPWRARHKGCRTYAYTCPFSLVGWLPFLPPRALTIPTYHPLVSSFLSRSISPTPHHRILNRFVHCPLSVLAPTPAPAPTPAALPPHPTHSLTHPTFTSPFFSTSTSESSCLILQLTVSQWACIRSDFVSLRYRCSALLYLVERFEEETQEGIVTLTR